MEVQISHVRTSKIGGLDCPEYMYFINILGRRLLALKHVGARPSIHPNLNRFSVTLRLNISDPGLAYKLIAAATMPTTTADLAENSAPITHLLVV